MKSLKKCLSVLLTVVLMAVLMTGCGKKQNVQETAQETDQNTVTETPAADNSAETAEPTEPAATEAEKNPVTLATVSMFGGTDPNAGNYQAINDQFMKDNPYITLEDDSQSSDQDWKTKIAADFAVGNEPDVIQYFTDANASDVLAANKFVSIDEIKAEYPDYAKDTLETALKAAANPDGVQRAVPTTGYWEGLFCNKDLFDQYSLELPTDWDKMLKAIETFKANGIVPIAVSLNNVPHYWVEFLMLSAAGPEGYVSVPTEAPADWVKGLSMFKTLRDLGAFPEGKAPVGAMVGGISSGFYITKKAWDDPDKRDAAVKFVMAHTNKASVTTYWGGNGQAAAAVDPVDNMTPLGISGLNYSSAASSISAPTDSRLSQEAYNTLISGIVGVSTGDVDPADLLNEVLAVNAK